MRRQDNNIIFSIVMPSYNQGTFIREAIESIIFQSGEFYIDLIIKDGGSRDNAVVIIKEIEDELKKRSTNIKEYDGLSYFSDKTLQFIRCKGISYRWDSEKDNGFADAINKGLGITKGDIISYLNTDDYLLENALAIVSEVFYQNPGADIVYGGGLEVDADGRTINNYDTRDVTKHKLADKNALPQPSVFIKKSAIKKAGEFNEKIKNSIDYEYWLRLERLGFRFKMIKELLSATRIHKDTKTLRNRSRIILETIAIQKYYGGDLMKVDSEFVLGMSLIGRLTSLFLPKKIRTFLLFYITRLWIYKNRAHINSLVNDIFKPAFISSEDFLNRHL